MGTYRAVKHGLHLKKVDIKNHYLCQLTGVVKYTIH
jgi:hypothetical protein